jgi:hypothetical protein
MNPKVKSTANRAKRVAVAAGKAAAKAGAAAAGAAALRELSSGVNREKRRVKGAKVGKAAAVAAAVIATGMIVRNRMK